MTILCSLVHLIIHKIVNTTLSYIIHISTVSPDRLTLMPPNPSADRVQPVSVCHLFDAKFVHHFVLHHVAHIILGEVLFKPIHFRHPIPQVDDAKLASSTCQCLLVVSTNLWTFPTSLSVFFCVKFGGNTCLLIIQPLQNLSVMSFLYHF